MLAHLLYLCTFTSWEINVILLEEFVALCLHVPDALHTGFSNRKLSAWELVYLVGIVNISSTILIYCVNPTILSQLTVDNLKLDIVLA